MQMEKSDVRVVVGIIFLLALVLVINNSHWFVPDRFSEDKQTANIQVENGQAEQHNNAVEIMEKAEKEQGGFTVPEGKYFFDTMNGGIFDITSNDDNMQIDGKKLNQGCCLENYMPVENGIVEIIGEGTLTFRTIEGKTLQLKEENGKKLIQNSGYYLRDTIIGSKQSEVTLLCQTNDAVQEMPKIQILETYTQKVIDEFQWKSAEEKYICKLEKGQSLFVDLGNETKEERNILYIMD